MFLQWMWGSEWSGSASGAAAAAVCVCVEQGNALGYWRGEVARLGLARFSQWPASLRIVSLPPPPSSNTLFHLPPCFPTAHRSQTGASSGSRASVHEEVGIARNGVIHPSSKGRIAWDLVLGLFILYTVFVVPYRISFLQVRGPSGPCWWHHAHPCPSTPPYCLLFGLSGCAQCAQLSMFVYTLGPLL